MEKYDMMPEIRLNMPSSKTTLDPETAAITRPQTARSKAPAIDFFKAFSSIDMDLLIDTLYLV